ncbi:MAG: SDR family NAD(P)-dependent oxidoreductase [bacterium]|nr:SDR family NAD(P)-dependent oxidoreductase [bacterium]
MKLIESDHTKGPDQRLVSEPIAIIGIGCLFPKAADLRAYWANIVSGVDAITDVPETHWRRSDYYAADPKAQDRTTATRGGFLPPIDFDPLEFGVQPKVIEATDSSQLLGMYAAGRALKNAGYGPDTQFNRDRVSVLLGVTGALELTTTLGARLGHPRWRDALMDAGVDDGTAEDVISRISESYVPWQENSFPGLLGNVVAGRISNYLDLGGTNCVVDAACASSLSALHLAVMELQTGRSDMVVSGGVDSFNDIFMYTCFSKTHALSPSGDARPFDADGDGRIVGEGIGLIVLKRLQDAERDNDRIYAVIRSIGTSSDGKGNAIYAPSAEGQKKALRDAYERAGVTPDTVELVEAHGTGTKVGDAVELSALKDVYGDAPSGPWCAVGSVKSQIGHAKAAAGAAGIIKVAMALHHKVLPPTIKVEVPIDELTQKGAPFYVNSAARPWLPNADHPRRAAVSAFGFGGSNFHCVLEEHCDEKKAAAWDGNVELVAFSADGIEGLKDALREIAKEASWEDFARCAAGTRLRFDSGRSHRLLLVATPDCDRPARFLKAATMLDEQADKMAWSTPDGTWYGRGDRPGKLAFVFPGQGAQYVGMCRDLACRFPEFLQALTFADAASDGLTDAMYPPAAWDAETKAAQDATLRDTRTAQPAIGAISSGALRLLARFGVAPDAVAGHSYGELVALNAAGRLDADALRRLSKLRGALMHVDEGDKGGMIAVTSSPAMAETVIQEAGLNLVIANKNAPEQVVLSGGSEEIQKAKEAFVERDIRCTVLDVSAAFHSEYVADAAEPLLEALINTKISPATIPVFANTTAEEYPLQPGDAREILAFQLARPVEYVELIENVYAAGVRTFLEVGPGARQTGLIANILAGRNHSALALDSSSGKRSGVVDFARSLAQLAALGHTVDLSCWNEGCADAEVRKPKLVVPISGANYAAPREKRPPAPKPTPGATRSTECVSEVAPAAAQAIQTVQANIIALQKMQEQTARLHQQFLDGQQASARALSEMLGGRLSTVPDAEPLPVVASEATGVLERAPESPEPEPIPTPAAETSMIETILLGTVADKTGYPVDMLELDMSLDSDLGIDSIKRVEILSDLQEQLPEAPTIEAHHLGELQTLRQIVDHLAAGVTVSQQPAASAPVPTADEGPSQIESILLGTVADKTGYPVDMLELDMSLDSDLGIDSIKRVEILSDLQEQLPEAPTIEAHHLGELQTLRQIVDHLAAGVTVSQQPGAPAPILTANGEPSHIESILLGTVADKTGYPVDMLELDMSLDSDLGIDSIKRVEILSDLQEQLPEAPTIESHHLGELQTLRHIVDHLTHVTILPTVASEPEPKPVREVPTSNKTVERLVLSIEPMELDSNRELANIDKSAPIWITNDGAGLAVAIQSHLIDLGYSTELIAIDRENLLSPPTELAGLLIVAPPEGSDDAFLSDAFRVLQQAEVGLRGTGAGAGAVFATVSRLDGCFGLGDGASNWNPICGGLAGLSKTARLEWPDVRCVALDVGDDFPGAEQAAEAVVAELFVTGSAEVGLSNGRRCGLRLDPNPLPTEQIAEDELPVKAGDVVVVSGGARGVTAEVAATLGEATQATLVLLGRSLEPHDEPDWLASLTGQAEIKRAIVQNDSANITPKELQQQYQAVKANREIVRNIERMTVAGAKVKYFSVDLRDAEAVATVIAHARQEFGPIKGIIHGAGVLADRLIADKTMEQFAHVYSTKVGGLRSLLTATEVDDLRFMVLFSSSTGRFGRTGQIDYSVANEVLNRTAQSESRRRPNCRVVAVNWGPWDGGMVTPALKGVFEAEGIALIDREAGSQYLLGEIANPRGPVEVVLMGGPLPVKTDAVTESPKTLKLPETLDKAFELELNVRSHPFLKSHVLNGHTALPAAMTIDWLAHGAMHANLGLRFHGLNELRVFKGVTIEGNETAALRILAGPALQKGETYAVPVEMRGTVSGNPDRLFASAEVLLAASLPQGTAAIDDTAGHPYPDDDIYGSLLFHGPELQCLSSVKCGPNGVISALAAPGPPPSQWMDKPLRSAWLASPLAIDAGFQLMLLWGFQQQNAGSLPSRVGEYRQFKRSFPKTGVRVVVHITEHDEHRSVARIEFTNPTSGELVARMTDCECVIDASLNEAFRRNTLRLESISQAGSR